MRDIKYIDHYLNKLGGPMGLVNKPPANEIPPDIEEVQDLFVTKVALRSLYPETSTYHAKVLPVDDAEKLVRVEEDVELRGLEHIIPYRTAHDIVLKNPQNIVVFDCPCRSLQEEPCEPLDVCMAVGYPMASFIQDHLGDRARKVTAEEAVEIIRAGENLPYGVCPQG